MPKPEQPSLAQPQSTALVPLRHDLCHYPGPRDRNGAPSHVLHDPAAESYFHIGAMEFEMLTRWHLGTAQKIADDMSATSTFRATTEDVEKFAQQLRLNGLLRCRAADIIQAKKAAKNNQADIASRNCCANRWPSCAVCWAYSHAQARTTIVSTASKHSSCSAAP